MSWIEESRWRLVVPLVCVAIMAAGLWAQPVLAQGAADGAAEEAEGPPPDPASPDAQAEESLLSLAMGTGRTGWLFMGILLAFSFFGVTVAIERTVNMRRSRVLPSKFLGEVRVLTGNGQASVESFRDLCSSSSAPVARVLEAGVLRCGRPLPEIEKSMEDAAVREMATLRGGIRPLSTVGSVAPLVGLLGTVVGMIGAFRTASQMGLGKGEQMAEGIYLALLTTAGGLTIAIPALLLSALFNAKAERFFREIDESLLPTVPCLARLPEPGTAVETAVESE